MVKLAIFDLDDTIFHTEESAFNLENETAAQMGFSPMSREIHKKTFGKPLKEAIVERIPGIDPESFTELLIKKLPTHVKAGKIDPVRGEVLEALDKLKRSGRQISILTSRTQGEVAHLLDKDHPIFKRASSFYYFEKTQHHKPDPKVFNEVLQHHGITAAEAVYIGDSISDAQSSKEAGLYFIAYLGAGLRKIEDFNELKVDHFAKDFSQIPEIISNLS